eukprot:TRINITY_DN9463_c0_g1_i1.p1 TRINITY_DN9463_c0_g1~~TRINITY_DN9463_c0_g1_i1.p1  ORF type:complete len:396 (-),score=40.23 TRINITY_DN9463_c0_g1_i1:61-1248(-)
MASFIDHTDLSWVRPHLPLAESERQSAELVLHAWDNAGGLSGSMRKLVVILPETNRRLTYVYKCIREGGHTQSAQLGLPREAFFYNYLAEQLRKEHMPLAEVICARGDMETGDKVLVLEDLSEYGIQSGYLYGPGSPLNWQIDLAAKLATVPVPLSTEEVALDSFQQAAKLHRSYWKDERLFQHSWLRGSAWLQGEGKESWLAAQKTATDCWAAEKEKLARGESGVRWDDHLVACVEVSLAKINWENYVHQMREREWTLVHGDFHPGNMVWCWTPDHPRGRSVMVDWEMVGIGAGPQDLAQSLISHMTPELRRREERRLVEAYYEILIECERVQDYTFEACWKDYVDGGCERWIWLLLLLSGMCPPIMTQYFHDQVAAFVRDHYITPDTIGMPRV